MRLLQKSLQAAKNLVGLVGYDQVEDGIDQPAIKPLQESAAAQRIEDCFLNPGGLSIPGLFYAESDSWRLQAKGRAGAASGREQPFQRAAPGYSFLKKSRREKVTRSPAWNGRSKPVTGRVAGPHTCRCSGVMTNSHTCGRGARNPRPEATNTHMHTSLSCFYLPHYEKPV